MDICIYIFFLPTIGREASLLLGLVETRRRHAIRIDSCIIPIIPSLLLLFTSFFIFSFLPSFLFFFFSLFLLFLSFYSLFFLPNGTS